MSLKYQASALDKNRKATHFTTILANNKDEALQKAWAKFYELGIRPASVKVSS